MNNINDLRGHHKNRDLLKKQLRENFVSGSYLFSGMEAIGKKKTAMWFAQLVNCEESDAPCGVCRSCRNIEKGLHPDVVVITRLEEKTVITIDQIREQLLNESNFKPLEGRYRVFIIDDAHLLNDQAQNSLLKVLEEPGNAIIIVLVTNRPSELIGTILSRCRSMKFFPLSKEDMDAILRSNPDIPEDRVHLVAATAAGSPGKAINQALDDQFWKMRKSIFSTLELLPDGRNGIIIRFLSSFKIARTDVEHLESVFEIILSWFRDILFIQDGMDNSYLINRDFRDSLDKVAYCYEQADIFSIQELILEVRKLVFENNMNIQLGLQRILIKIKQFGSVRL